MKDEKNQARQKPEHEFSMQWEHSDVVLLVEVQHFHVHRAILGRWEDGKGTLKWDNNFYHFSRLFSVDYVKTM